MLLPLRFNVLSVVFVATATMIAAESRALIPQLLTTREDRLEDRVRYLQSRPKVLRTGGGRMLDFHSNQTINFRYRRETRRSYVFGVQRRKTGGADPLLRSWMSLTATTLLAHKNIVRVQDKVYAFKV